MEQNIATLIKELEESILEQSGEFEATQTDEALKEHDDPQWIWNDGYDVGFLAASQYLLARIRELDEYKG